MLRKGFLLSVNNFIEAVRGCKAPGTFPGAVLCTSDERASTPYIIFFLLLYYCIPGMYPLGFRIATFEFSVFVEGHHPVRAKEIK